MRVARVLNGLVGRLVARMALAIFFLTLPPFMAARAVVAIQEVKSASGVTAWLVEDYSVPLISIQFAFEGGSTQDPAGKDGLANLMTGLFDEGAGDLDSNAFQDKLDDAGAEMGFQSDPDAVYGSMRMLAEQKDAALSLLKLSIGQPRFDQAPLDRIRAQIVTGIKAAALDPSTKADIAFSKALYGGHPYARQEEGTPETLASITPADLKVLHQRIFARGRLKVGVVGAIDAKSLAKVLDDLFGGLPEQPALAAVADVRPQIGQQIRVDYNLPQTTMQLVYPAVPRKAPDFFAAYLMNHVLGGGTFSSRLFSEVREKRGLAYSVGSGISGREHADSLVIGTSTRSDRAAETLAVIKAEVQKMATTGPTADELAAAKKYLIGVYAISNLDSSMAVARTLVEIQRDDLPIDYMARRDALIDGVTLDQAKAAARKLLAPPPSVLLVGPADKTGG